MSVFTSKKERTVWERRGEESRHGGGEKEGGENRMMTAWNPGMSSSWTPRTRAHTHTLSHTHALTQTRAHTHTHTHTHTLSLTHTHTHTHTHYSCLNYSQ